MNYKERQLLNVLLDMSKTQRQLIDTLAEYMDSDDKDVVTEDSGEIGRGPAKLWEIKKDITFIPINPLGRRKMRGTTMCSSTASDHPCIPRKTVVFEQEHCTAAQESTSRGQADKDRHNGY